MFCRTLRFALPAAAAGSAFGLSINNQAQCIDETTKQAAYAVMFAGAGFAAGYVLQRNTSDRKGLYDLELDLLDRGRSVKGKTSDLAQKTVGMFVESGQHAGVPYVYRVVLTGGPCGGKSSSLKHLTVNNCSPFINVCYHMLSC